MDSYERESTYPNKDIGAGRGARTGACKDGDIEKEVCEVRKECQGEGVLEEEEAEHPTG